MTAKPLLECLACGARDLRQVLDLGTHPPVNCLVESPGAFPPTYPVVLNHCAACGHGQLSLAVDPQELFGAGYLYATASSRAMVDYFEWMAAGLGAALPGARVLEIACNDGTLLGAMRRHGLRPMGIEPDKALATQARFQAPVLQEFWPAPRPTSLFSFDLILAANVLAHVANPLGFLLAARDCLAPGGRVLVQVCPGEWLESGNFTICYHEHLSYPNRGSMESLGARAGLALVESHRTRAQGSSDVYVFQRFGEVVVPCLGFLGDAPWGLGAVPPPPLDWTAAYAGFATAVQRKLAEVRGLVLGAQGAGRPVAFLGASAKALVVLQATGLRPDLVLDDSPLKIGKWIPGLGLQIRPSETLADLENPLLVISAWNCREEIEGRVAGIRQGQEAELAVYFPALEVWRV